MKHILLLNPIFMLQFKGIRINVYDVCLKRWITGLFEYLLLL